MMFVARLCFDVVDEKANKGVHQEHALLNILSGIQDTLLLHMASFTMHRAQSRSICLAHQLGAICNGVELYPIMRSTISHGLRVNSDLLQ